MRVPSSAGKGSDRLAAALVPRLHQLHLRSPASPAGNSLYKIGSTGSGVHMGSLLHAANAAYQREHGVSQDIKSAPTQAPRNPPKRPVNPDYRNPLNRTSANALNRSRNEQAMPSTVGVKRTSSGLAKSLSGSFEEEVGSQRQPYVVKDTSPGKSKASNPVPPDLFDENDFDSDIDLEVEEPKPLQSITYPKLPQHQFDTSQPKPIFRPTVSRQQQAQQLIVVDDDMLPEPACSPTKPNGSNPPNSSAPLPWSSSPAEHYKAFRIPETSKRVAREASAPTKKRHLPWEKAEEVQAVHTTHSSMSNNTGAKGQGMFTPRSTATKRDANPWNTSASAVKQQQKQHREERKRSVQQHNELDETIVKKSSTRKSPAQIFLSDEQKHVLNLVVEKHKSVFFTGSAGTGKSVLMREIISSLRKKYIREPDRVAVTASTGLAACNVGGVTLHSFAGIGLGKEEVSELVRRIKKNQKARHRWLRTKVLVVDEVSMVDGDLFDKLESIARQIRNNARPFGGIQLVITGDFFQLPPVPDDKKSNAKFAFDAATWPTSVEHTIALHHVFRQKDPVFAGMLNEMREGRLSEVSIRAFTGLSRNLDFEDMLDATELFPLRSEVEKANVSRLDMLQGNTHAFNARDGGTITDKTYRDKLLQNCMAPEVITLKKGAQVMLIKNVDESLVNGSIGRVIGFFTDSEFDRYNIGDQSFPQSPGGTIQATQGQGLLVEDVTKRRPTEGVTTAQRWPLVRFNLVDGTWRELLCQPEAWKIELPNGEVQASRTQLPLILAWALSIHKAQGQTLDRVKVNLQKVFEKGQAYVALSRATSMAGLQVLNFDPKKVIAHERVRTFYSNLSRVELQNKTKERTEKKSGATAQDYERQFIDDAF